MRKVNLGLPTVLLASVALVSSLGLPASSASAAGRRDAQAAITVHGAVTTASGKADPGVRVVIHAWPDQNVVAGLKIGQKVAWVVAGTATTNSSGDYSASIPVAKLVPESTDGVVNMEADSSAGDYSFSVAIAKNSGNAYLAAPDPVADIGDSSDSFSCPGFWRYYGSLGKHWATIGQTYAPTSHVDQKFSYAHGQFSTMAVGTSNSGGFGTFSADGAMSWSKTGSTGSGGSWPYFGGYQNLWYRTEFHWGEYICDNMGILGGYEEHVNGYFGGAHHENPKVPPHTHKWNCAPYDGGGFVFQSNDSEAVTWQKGFGVHAGLGFDSSVVTGYDSSAQVDYKLLRPRWICGQYGPPEGSSPRQLVVHRIAE
jgi:hypothetical protein